MCDSFCQVSLPEFEAALLNINGTKTTRNSKDSKNIEDFQPFYLLQSILQSYRVKIKIIITCKMTVTAVKLPQQFL